MRLVESVRVLEQFLLPNACIACGVAASTTDRDALVCRVCVSRMRQVVPECGRCGHPRPPVGSCRFCADWPDSLIRARSAVWLGPEAQRVMHRFKYGHSPNLGRLAAEIIAANVSAPAVDALIPIPMTAAKQSRRGYNQAYLLAKGLSARWNLPVAPSMLRRTRESGTQTALTPAARLANVAGAFSGSALPLGVHKPRVALIDDVLTTGATVCGAATALGMAGWGDIEVVTFARALTYAHRLRGQDRSPGR